MIIGIIKENKVPIDKRVPLTPLQCKELMENNKGLKIIVESSETRSFTDKEYKEEGIKVVTDISKADILLGVKEVPEDLMIEGKTYFMFSHTIKKQEYNKSLLKAAIDKKIKLVDYECLLKHNYRVIGFGRWAGMVGAYNALLAYGNRTKTFSLKPANQCFDFEEVKSELSKVELGAVKFVITGNGRVANGALELLNMAGVKKVTPSQLLKSKAAKPNYAQLEIPDYFIHEDGFPTVANDFIKDPDGYESDFLKYAEEVDVYISGHYWNGKGPSIITREDFNDNELKLKVVADVSCDIGGPIECTLRSSTIEDPIYGYDPSTGKECKPYDEKGITVMAVDNLPCEIPRNASEDFGAELASKIIPYLINGDTDDVIKNASITDNGEITERYEYLKEWVNS